MTDSTTAPSGDLSALKVAQLQQIAARLGIKGARRMRKSELIDALRSGQAGAAAGDASGAAPAAPAASPPSRSAGTRESAQGGDTGEGRSGADRSTATTSPPDRTQHRRPDGQGEDDARKDARSGKEAQDGAGRPAGTDRQSNRERQDGNGRQHQDRQSGKDRHQSGKDQPGAEQHRQGREQRGHQDSRGSRQRSAGEASGAGSKSGAQEHRRPSVDDIQLPEPRALELENDARRSARGGGPDFDSRSEDDRSNRRRRGRERNRDRKRRPGRPGDDQPYEDIELSPDDVLIPIGGILDILDNYAFVRTSGYLPGANDVYVSLNQVKRYGLRRGDAIVGAVRQPREGEQANQRQKFNALVRLDTVNGAPGEESPDRPAFGSLTPLFPQERLRLETKASEFTTRTVDLVTPLGKGQRALIAAPPRTGKTMVLQHLADAITTNNPEAHLMVVLVDERPEEVTSMERSVKGEVISSTFDRPATDHTVVAELAIERAKRLVELGQDVVVLLDSLTALARAYNATAPASGRVLAGGVDIAAMHPPKRFFGAARNIEHGGSLTIVATALVDTGSAMDEVIFEQIQGTPNAELWLDRGLAEKRIFPAVDINRSSTRREDLLMSEHEVQMMWKLRRSIASLDPQQAIETMLTTMRGTATNAEFLAAVNKKSTAGGRSASKAGP